MSEHDPATCRYRIEVRDGQIETLREDLAEAREKLAEVMQELTEAMALLADARGALWWYADEAPYSSGPLSTAPDGASYGHPIMWDRGERARKALEGTDASRQS